MASIRWIWVVAIALPFAAPALIDGVFVGNGTDLFSYQLPMRRALKEILSGGELPTWNPWILAGVPMLAGMQLGVVYPPNWLTGLLSPEYGVELSLLLHGLWIVTGAAFVSHALRQRWSCTMDAPALVTAAIFALSGQLWGHIFAGHVSYWQAWSWGPWVWGLALHVQMKPTGRLGLLLAASIALQLLAGHPQVSYLTAMGLIALLICRLWALPTSRSVKSISLLALAGLGAAGLAAVQLFPTLEIAPDLNRSLANASKIPLAFSAPPQTLLTSLAWDAFGGPSPRLTSFSYHETQAFIGATAIALALFAFVTVPRMWPLALFVLLFGALSVGSNGPVMPALLGVMPGLELFRVPARWLLPATGLIALAAGQALHHYGQGRLVRRRLMLAVVVLAICALFALMVSVEHDKGWWRELIRRPAKSASLPDAVDRLRLHLWLCLLAMIAGGVMLFRASSTRLQWVLAILVLAEGLWFCAPHLDQRFHWPRERVDWSTGLAKSLQEQTGSQRLATSPRLRHANWGGAHRVAIAGGYETAVPMWTNVYFNRVRKRPGRRYAVNLQTGYDSRLLDRLAVHHYLRRVRGKRLRGWRQVASAGVVALDRNPTPVPRVGFAQQVQIEPSRQRAIKRLESLPLSVTLLQGELLHDPGGIGRVLQTHVGATHLSAQVYCDRPKVLVVRDALTAGWSATIDGKPAEMIVADGLFRALSIPAGEHLIDMNYQAPGLRMGAWTSALLWGLWILLWVVFPKLNVREP